MKKILLVKHILLIFILLITTEFNYLFADNQSRIKLLKEKILESSEVNKSEFLNLIAMELWWEKDRSLPIKYAKEALELARQYRQEKQQIYALVSISHSYRRQKIFRLAHRYISKALNLARKRKSKEEILHCLISYERILEFENFQNNLKKCITNLLEIISLCKDLNKHKDLAVYMHTTGSIFGRLGKNKSALKYTEEALKLYREIGDQDSEIQMLAYLAAYNYKSGNNKKALEYYLEAEKTGLKYKNYEKICRVYSTFGRFYKSLNKNKLALHYWKKELELAENHNYSYWRLSAYAQVSELLIDLGKYDLALVDYIKKGFEVVKTKDFYKTHDYNIMLNLNSGRAYFGKNQYNKCLAYYIKSLMLSKEMESNTLLIRTYKNIGILFRKKNLYKTALGYLNKGMELSKEISANKIYAEITLLIHQIYTDLGKKKKSKKFLEQYNQIVNTQKTHSNINDKK